MDYETIFDELEDRLTQIDYEPTTRGQFEVEEDDSVVSYRFISVETDVGPDFVILVREGDGFCRLQAEYNLWADVASQVSEDQIEKLVDPEEVKEIPEDHVIREFPVNLEELEEQQIKELLAAAAILTEVGQEARQETIYQLTDIFTSAEVKHVIDSTPDSKGLTAFTVYHKIFPQEDDFSLSRLNDAVERIRMSAHRGEIFLRYAFGLGVDMDRHPADEIENSFESPPAR
jgi:hypothetical protein